jgi:hypothetical protein
MRGQLPRSRGRRGGGAHAGGSRAGIAWPAEDAVHAVGDADEEFAHSSSSDDPPYVRYFDAAEHAGETGHAYFPLSRPRPILERACNLTGMNSGGA